MKTLKCVLFVLVFFVAGGVMIAGPGRTPVYESVDAAVNVVGDTENPTILYLKWVTFAIGTVLITSGAVWALRKGLHHY